MAEWVKQWADILPSLRGWRHGLPLKRAVRSCLGCWDHDGAQTAWDRAKRLCLLQGRIPGTGEAPWMESCRIRRLWGGERTLSSVPSAWWSGCHPPQPWLITFLVSWGKFNPYVPGVIYTILSKMLPLCKSHLTSMVLLSFFHSQRKANSPVPGEGGAGGQGESSGAWPTPQCSGWAESVQWAPRGRPKREAKTSCCPQDLCPACAHGGSASRTSAQGEDVRTGGTAGGWGLPGKALGLHNCG